MADKPDHSGHRQRLRDRFLTGGPDALADYEMLELVLFLARARGDVKPLAKRLIEHFGSYAAAISADPVDLRQVDGVGDSTIAVLKTVQEAAVRLAREQVMNRPVLGSWRAVLDYCRARLAHEKVERFRTLYLDNKNRLIADEEHNRGTVNQTMLYPRELVKRALDLGASNLILVHNHPTGDPTPSEDDIETTRLVIEAAKPLGIAIHDHLVIGKHGHSSLRSLGLMG